MNIINLALANIKKGKAAAASLFIFILVAALLLNVGLMVINQISTFYDNKVEELNDAHATIIMDQKSFTPAHEEFIENYTGVKTTELEEIILMNSANFEFGGSELTNGALIMNSDEERSISPLKLIEKLDTSHNNDIYVSYSFKTSGGYELGDDFTITYQDKNYDFQIAGFFETTMMGTNNMGIMKFMLPEKSYLQIEEELQGQAVGVMLSAVFQNTTQSSELLNDYTKEFPHSTVGEGFSWGVNIEIVKSVNTITINIVATLLVAFAAIIVLVSLIVIKFRVSNSIEDGMVNIGVLKAIGYTSGQILSSMILQFILIALSAGVVGIMVSYAIMPFFGGIISSLSGLIWSQKFDIVINLISLLIIVLLVLFVTLFSSLRIRNILPVAALRGGIHTHSFKKNHFQLEKATGSLHFLLACKSMLANAKQNIMITVIIAALTFASVFSIVLYYNIASDKTVFVNLFGTEPSNVMITVKPDTDTRKLLREIENMEHVEKTNIFDMILTKIDGQSVPTNITDDYDLLENNTVYDGRQPKLENEISISWVVSNQINKGIGDTVEVELGTKTNRYLITGISQSITNLGQIASLTMTGVKQLSSDYKGTTINVYLEDIDNKEFIDIVEEKYGNSIVDVLDIDENIESQTGIYTSAVFAVMLLVLIITVLVVITMLYLVIKTMIIKRKKEYGIMKAIGYSTIQLMNQIAMSFVPIIIIGVVIGGVLGYFFTNPMLAVLLSGAGVKRLEFIMSLPMITILGVALIVLAYIVSMIVSWKIKKISAYGLITE